MQFCCHSGKSCRELEYNKWNQLSCTLNFSSFLTGKKSICCTILPSSFTVPYTLRTMVYRLTILRVRLSLSQCLNRLPISLYLLSKACHCRLSQRRPFNVRHSVTSTYRMGERVRWDKYQPHVIHSPDRPCNEKATSVTASCCRMYHNNTVAVQTFPLTFVLKVPGTLKQVSRQTLQSSIYKARKNCF